MKLLFSICVGCLLSVDTYSQVVQSDSLKTLEVKSKFSFGEIQSKGANHISEDQRIEIRNKLDLIESHLEAIEIKRKFILDNPDQKAIADREGWFTDMARQIDELNERKRALNALLLL
jgi:hypothetical protein